MCIGLHSLRVCGTVLLDMYAEVKFQSIQYQSADQYLNRSPMTISGEYVLSMPELFIVCPRGSIIGVMQTAMDFTCLRRLHETFKTIGINFPVAHIMKYK
jgi:hypothetical protein